MICYKNKLFSLHVLGFIQKVLLQGWVMVQKNLTPLKDLYYMSLNWINSFMKHSSWLQRFIPSCLQFFPFIYLFLNNSFCLPLLNILQSLWLYTLMRCIIYQEILRMETAQWNYYHYCMSNKRKHSIHKYLMQGS